MTLTPEEIALRKSRPLAQIEGWEPLPSQLNRDQVSEKLRVALIDLFDRIFEVHYGSDEFIHKTSGHLFLHLWSDFETKPVSEMHDYGPTLQEWYKSKLRTKDARAFYSLLDHTLRGLVSGIEFYAKNDLEQKSRYKAYVYRFSTILNEHLSPYRAHPEGFLYPAVDDLTVDSVRQAIDATASLGGGTKTHFRAAIRLLAEGAFAKSAKESWDTRESCVIKLGGKPASFSESLNKLTNDGAVPKLIAASWSKILAYANDTPGIRHPLQQGETPNVYEADAIYMLSACGAAVTYLSAQIK